MTYVEADPTHRVVRDRGIWIPVVTYATWKGRPEEFEARACLTAWGAHRVGRRECERIRTERAEPVAVAVRRFEELSVQLRDAPRGEGRAMLLGQLSRARTELDEALQSASHDHH